MNPETPRNPPPNEGKKSYLPSRKVGASALAGALSVLVVWIINVFVLTGPTKITGEVASAITTILTFIVGYIIPEPA
jgi:hypothetical protein